MRITELFEGPLAGHVHGIITVLSLALLVGAIWKFASTPNRYRVAAGVIFGVAAIFAAGTVTFHACERGQPVLYVIYAGASVAALTIFCGKRPLAIILSIILFAVFFGLARDYSRLVHTNDFIGDPNAPDNAYPKGSIYVLIDARSFVAGCQGQAARGFLSDALKSGAWDPGKAAEDPRFALVRDNIEVEKARVRWYTYFTLIWRFQKVRCGIWTPGGNVAADVELRER